ncbi:hypothetical protein CAEBREN_23185 [Caenorhabditis brenneri]|uniref:Uncharacterized protein n=1 Tax=Caenorhabditis brenneri TaxID=135651 RepID=G0MWS3_CAEBE|nr:hypothetical protein CAEBREN_23185 [Caenorhabditis brenneri]
MPFQFTGLFAVLYTLFVYSNVLLKEDQNYKMIIIAFCAAWILVYLLKKLHDCSEYPGRFARHKDTIATGLIIFNVDAANTKHHLFNLAKRCEESAENEDDFMVFLSATLLFASYFLLIRKSSKECEWDKTISWKYEPIPYFLAVCHLIFLYLPLVDEKVKATDYNIFVFYQVALSVIWASSCFELCAIMMENLKPKNSVEDNKRPTHIAHILVDEGIPLETVNNAAEGVLIEKKTN